MKLKKNLKDILSKYKWFAIALLILAVLVSSFVLIHHNKDKKEKEYSDLLNEYNRLINEYNEEIDMLNNFLEKISTYDLIEYSEKFVHKDKLSNLSIEISDDELSAMKRKIENIQNETVSIKHKYQEACQISYDSIIDNYNRLAKCYNNYVKTTSVELIQDMPERLNTFDTHTVNVQKEDFIESALIKEIDNMQHKLDEAVYYYKIIDQITVPTEEWVIQRLSQVKNIIGIKAVTSKNDPNGLLNKEGGYSSCIYFNISDSNIKKFTGDDIIKEGVDGGGAIEIYPTVETALNRCEYLSQFDNTLLYSGSYAIIGTCVIRTSYKLDNQEQVNLTNDIVEVFTEIK